MILRRACIVAALTAAFPATLVMAQAPDKAEEVVKASTAAMEKLGPYTMVTKTTAEGMPPGMPSSLSDNEVQAWVKPPNKSYAIIKGATNMVVFNDGQKATTYNPKSKRYFETPVAEGNSMKELTDPSVALKNLGGKFVFGAEETDPKLGKIIRLDNPDAKIGKVSYYISAATNFPVRMVMTIKQKMPGAASELRMVTDINIASKPDIKDSIFTPALPPEAKKVSGPQELMSPEEMQEMQAKAMEAMKNMVPKKP